MEKSKIRIELESKAITAIGIEFEQGDHNNNRDTIREQGDYGRARQKVRPVSAGLFTHSLTNSHAHSPHLAPSHPPSHPLSPSHPSSLPPLPFRHRFASLSAPKRSADQHTCCRLQGDIYTMDRRRGEEEEEEKVSGKEEEFQARRQVREPDKRKERRWGGGGA